MQINFLKMSLIYVSMQNDYVCMQDNYIDIQVTSLLSKSDSYVVKLLERVGINILDVNIINLLACLHKLISCQHI